jgi:hypothetical protein
MAITLHTHHPDAPTRRGSGASSREGLTLGLYVATAVWLWLAAVDFAVGDPFRTFHVLGGIAVFTAVHYALCIAYGRVLVWAVRVAADEPSVILGVLVLSLLFQFAFAMAAIMLSALGLGSLAWLRIFGGSLVASAVALRFLSRHYPLPALVRRAHEEQ